VKFIWNILVEFRNFFRLCEHCWAMGEFKIAGVWLRACYTMYDWDGKGQNPNRQPWLCDACNEEYHEYWMDMWSNVPGYGG
jgi:hypothetical protein